MGKSVSGTILVFICVCVCVCKQLSVTAVLNGVQNQKYPAKLVLWPQTGTEEGQALHENMAAASDCAPTRWNNMTSVKNNTDIKCDIFSILKFSVVLVMQSYKFHIHTQIHKFSLFHTHIAMSAHIVVIHKYTPFWFYKITAGVPHKNVLCVVVWEKPIRCDCSWVPGAQLGL